MAYHRFVVAFLLSLWNLNHAAAVEMLPLPPRPQSALTGSQLAASAAMLTTNLIERENFIYSQIVSGNVPDFLRHLCTVAVTDLGEGGTNMATIYVTPDYLALGSDADYFLTPLTPLAAQRIADALDCSLPTKKIVDAIYATAEVTLAPQPMLPEPEMITVPRFAEHNAIVRTQRFDVLNRFPLGALVAGDKKDVVISARLAGLTNKVAIYGWQRTNGVPIQPLYTGHRADWADYSHGVRLVSKHVLINFQPTNLGSILANPTLCRLLSDEGVVAQSRYPTNFLSTSIAQNTVLQWHEGLTTNAEFGELDAELHLPPDVRIHINMPSQLHFARSKPIRLIFYAVPNGNTIEQTIGKKLQPGDDWHFDIQHIGAQTRFLRHVITNRTIVVAYLENSLKSWPARRHESGDAEIPELLATVERMFPTNDMEIVLTGHSGGGSLTFGYLNSVTRVPDNVTRIAFLDSNYAYETTNHLAKLTEWLKLSVNHRLCVLAYHDSIALLNGKTFVSERGGTWGRSRAMLEDLSRAFTFSNSTNTAGLESYSANEGRIQFFLKENPEKTILHTVQVERNGFIHAMLTGTPLENCGYQYFGDRAYSMWIEGH